MSEKDWWNEVDRIFMELAVVAVYAALEDSKRLDYVLSWRGVNFLDAWVHAENTVPPTREDVDKAMEGPHE